MEKIEVDYFEELNEEQLKIVDSKGKEYIEDKKDLEGFISATEHTLWKLNLFIVYSNYLTWKYITLPQLKKGLAHGN